MAFQKPITIRLVDIDRYQRTAGRIYVNDRDVRAEMVRLGAAWVYRKHAKDQNLYRLEDVAKEDKRGLRGLSEAQRVTPWEWRRR